MTAGSRPPRWPLVEVPSQSVPHHITMATYDRLQGLGFRWALDPTLKMRLDVAWGASKLVGKVAEMVTNASRSTNITRNYWENSVTWGQAKATGPKTAPGAHWAHLIYIYIYIHTYIHIIIKMKTNKSQLVIIIFIKIIIYYYCSFR